MLVLPRPLNATPKGFYPNECTTTRQGSIIKIEAQTNGEAVDVVGTPFFLRYSSDRVPGRKAGYSMRIPLSGPSLPTDDVTGGQIDRIELRVDVAGRTFRQTFPAAPNQSTTFTWDGRDAYGRFVQGQVPATVTTSYVWTRSIYPVMDRFGIPTGLVGDSPCFPDPLSRCVRTRIEQPTSQVRTVVIGAFDAAAKSSAAGV